MTRTQRRAAMFIALLALACDVTACSSESTTPGSGSMPTTTLPPSSSVGKPLSAAEAAAQSAVAAYLGMWHDFVAAGRTSDWQSPQLGQFATGIALTNLSRGLYADHYNGLVTKGEPVLNPVVASADPPSIPEKIIVSDCGDSAHWLKYRADNGQLADTPGGRRSINAIVDKQADGAWKVSDFGVHDVGTC